jgi:hypothetical protein
MTLSLCCRAQPLVILRGLTEASVVCEACGKECDTITLPDPVPSAPSAPSDP